MSRNCSPDVSTIPTSGFKRVQRVRSTDGEAVAADVDQVLVDVGTGKTVNLTLARGRLGSSILIAVSSGTANVLRCDDCVDPCATCQGCGCDDCKTPTTSPPVTVGKGEQAIATFGLDCAWIVGKLVPTPQPPQ